MDDVTTDHTGDNAKVTRYCIFRGCGEFGYPVSEERCPTCGRYTSDIRPTSASVAPDHAPGPAAASTGQSSLTSPPIRLPSVLATSPETRQLEADARRVASVLSGLAWVVVIVGVLAAAILLLTSLAAGQPIVALVWLAAAIAYTAAAWAVLTLGSVIARYIASRSVANSA